jgi:hypothetical protein
MDDDDEPPHAPREGVSGTGTQSTPLVTSEESEKSKNVQTETSQNVPLNSDALKPTVQIPESPKH